MVDRPGGGGGGGGRTPAAAVLGTANGATLPGIDGKPAASPGPPIGEPKAAPLEIGRGGTAAGAKPTPSAKKPSLCIVSSIVWGNVNF